MNVIDNRHIDYYMRDKPLPRSLCDDRVLVLCI
jgi:hypothetical protein